MPIRFRCVYCNQLLGISRRKAGTIVRCTTCEGQLIVPEPSDPSTEAARDEGPQPQAVPKSEGSGEGPGGVFAASEFDEFLQPLHGGAAGGQAVASPPAPSPAKRSAAAPVVSPAEADAAL